MSHQIKSNWRISQHIINVYKKVEYAFFNLEI